MHPSIIKSAPHGSGGGGGVGGQLIKASEAMCLCKKNIHI